MTLPDIPTILNSIWDAGFGTVVFLPTQKRPGREWHVSKPVRPPIETLPPQEWGYDMYFSPMTFNGPEIRADMVAPGFVLYADLDKGDPTLIPPSILWETSPGSLQAVWFTTRAMDPEEHADLNKRLTYFLGADKGGWSAAKVLRVPCSLNFKRQYEDEGGIMVPRGRLLHADLSHLVSPHELHEMLPTLSTREVAPGEVPHIPDRPPSWDDVPVGLRAMFIMRYDDRSKRCFTVAKEFARRGLPAELAWGHLWFAPFNKYHDRPEVLWHTILQAYQKVDHKHD